MWYICNKTLVLNIICNNCDSHDQKIFKLEVSVEILKVLGLINNIKE